MKKWNQTYLVKLKKWNKSSEYKSLTIPFCKQKNIMRWQEGRGYMVGGRGVQMVCMMWW